MRVLWIVLTVIKKDGLYFKEKIMENLEAFTIQIIVKHLKGATPENVTLDSKLIDDLGGDSLDAIEVVMDLEDEFHFEFPEDRVKEISTVRDVIELTRTAITEFRAKTK